MPSMTEEQRNAFLAEPRYGVLTLLREDGSPIGVPIWFEWTGEAVRMFTNVNSPKMARLASDPRASLLVANGVDEAEAWIAFDGAISVREEGGLALAEKLADRYWDLSNPDHAGVLEFWRQNGDALRLLELAPDRIRSYRF